jgi:hypothetical protein
MIFELMIVVCMAKTILCSEVAFADAEALTLEGCLSRGPERVQNITSQHPYNTVTGYYCRRRIS